MIQFINRGHIKSLLITYQAQIFISCHLKLDHFGRNILSRSLTTRLSTKNKSNFLGSFEMSIKFILRKWLKVKDISHLIAEKKK